MLDENSKLEMNAELSILKHLAKYNVPTRIVCQGSYTLRTKRQIMKCLSIFNDKYYIYFRGVYKQKSANPSVKESAFSSVVLVDWSSGSPVELEHQHIEDSTDIHDFLTILNDYIEEENRHE
jgi:hypothetical protein